MKAGWQTKEFGDVCNVIGGSAPSKDKAHPAFYSDDIRWATARGMKSDLISDTEFKPTPATPFTPAYTVRAIPVQVTPAIPTQAAPVIPAKAGIQDVAPPLDSRVRGNDDEGDLP